MLYATTKTNTIIGLAVALCLPFSSIAQQGVAQGTIEHEGAQRSAMIMELKLPKDHAKDHYKEFMKDRYDVRVKGLGFLQNKDLVSLKEVTMPALHTKAMDLYARFDDQGDTGTRMTMTGRDGYDLYFGPDHAPAVQQRLMGLLGNFKVYALEAYYTELLEEQNDKKKELIGDQEDAVDAIEDNKDEIEANLKDTEKREKKIKDLRKENKERAKQLEELQQEIAKSKVELPESK